MIGFDVEKTTKNTESYKAFILALHFVGVLFISGCASPKLEGSKVGDFFQGLSDNVSKSLGKINLTGGGAAQQVYRPIVPAKGARFEGLFHSNPQQHAIDVADYNGNGLHGGKRSMWPRAAVTFVKYGLNLECWTVRAKIWDNPKKFSVEEFEICPNVRIEVADDIGGKGYILEEGVSDPYITLENTSARWFKNTGNARTEGPLPPDRPFQLHLNSSGPINDGSYESKFPEVVHRVITRLGYVSGFIEFQDPGLTQFKDWRLWYYKFDPNGNVDKQ